MLESQTDTQPVAESAEAPAPLARLVVLGDLMPNRPRGKAAHILADQVRERILSGDFPEGALLPPERELLQLTGLSRATLREALRLLEAEGYLEIARGPHGGCIVRHPSVDRVARSFGFLLRLNQATMRQVLEVRWALEPLCAGLAARRVTDQHLDAMQRAMEAMQKGFGDQAAFYQANADFHLAIVRATRNHVLSLLAHMLRHLLFARLKRRTTAAERGAAMAAHEAIYAAIAAGDAERAVAETYRHLAAVEQEIADDSSHQEPLAPLVTGNRLPAEDSLRESRRVRRPAGTPGRKPAEPPDR